MQHCDYFNYWGKGTAVTVSSASPATPTLFPVVQCSSAASNKVTVGCLAQDFFPKQLTFAWTNARGTGLTHSIYPQAVKNSKYTQVSLVEVPKSDWDSEKSFTCSVTHNARAYSVKLKNRPPSPPKVTLVSGTRGDTQTLVCTIEDFFPRELSVKWKKNATDVTGFTDWTPKSTGETYLAVSVLRVSKTDWDNQAVYTCEVTHQQNLYSKKARKAVVTMTLNQPSPKEIFSNNQAKLECIITGQVKKNLEQMNFTWQTDGQSDSSNITTSAVTSRSGQHIRISTKSFSLYQWNKVKKVCCSAGTDDMTPISEDLTVHTGDGSKPEMSIHVLPQEDINQVGQNEVTLVCLVSSRALQNFYIAWTEDKRQNTGIYMDGITSPPQKTQKGYLVTSVYTTTKEKWNNGHKFGCNVWPAGSNNSLKLQEVSKAQDFTPESNLTFDLSCKDDFNEEDEFSSLWSTASSFIFLFIASLLYSMIFSLVKMKRE